jgi:hypothetical protein
MEQVAQLYLVMYQLLQLTNTVILLALYLYKEYGGRVQTVMAATLLLV